MNMVKASSRLRPWSALFRYNWADCFIYRLPNVFGKWCKPNYNSFIATFCNNVIKNIDISVHDPNSKVTLVYISTMFAHLLLKS